MSRTKPESAESLGFSATMRPGPVALPHKLDFFSLPRPVQDRFVAATQGSAPPAPLLFQRAPRAIVWVLLVGSLVLLGIAAILLHAGWGDATSSLALHGPKMLAADVAILAAAVYGVVHAMAILRRLDGLPFRAGTYVFPACVVEANEATLRVWPIGEAEAVDRLATPTPAVSFRMRDGSRVVVRAGSVADAERVDGALVPLREQLSRALAEEDPHLLAELDPLHDSALSSPIGPTSAMSREVPAWARLDWAIALGLGAALGVGLGTTRNSMSDEAMFRSVAAMGTVPAYQLYLSQGGRHSDDVRDVLLPRAELQIAAAQNTVEAVQAFSASHPGSKIPTEVDAVMRHAMLTQLDKAKTVGTVTALDEFAKKYPDHKLEPELSAARHALFVEALASWKQKATPDASTRAVVERLLASTEKNGPTCEVRFRLKPSQTLDDADKRVMKNIHYPGPEALPSKFLAVAPLRKREQRVALDVTQGFAADFPSDVLLVRVGDPLEPDAPYPTAIPTLVVEYAPEWSHANTVSERPPTVFAGINFGFDASLLVPNAPSLKLQTKAWRGAELWKTKSEGLTREEFEQKVYDLMIDGAFDQLDKKLKDTFF